MDESQHLHFSANRCAATAHSDFSQHHRTYNYKTGMSLTMDEMVTNLTYLFFLHEGNKHPVKRTDMVKYGMNGQFRQFDTVMNTFEKTMQETFGFKVVGLDERPKGANGFNNYMLLSKFKADLAESNINVRAQKGLEVKKGFLYLILVASFMLNKAVDIDTIWTILTTMGFEGYAGCPKKKEDLHKFLKHEYVSAQYLCTEESCESEGSDVITYWYKWGLRSHQELSKWAILKYVANNFPNTKPQDYDYQFKYIKEIDREMVTIRVDLAQQAIDRAARAALPKNREGGHKGTLEYPNIAATIFEKMIQVNKEREKARRALVVEEATETENEEASAFKSRKSKDKRRHRRSKSKRGEGEEEEKRRRDKRGDGSGEKKKKHRKHHEKDKLSEKSPLPPLFSPITKY